MTTTTTPPAPAEPFMPPAPEDPVEPGVASRRWFLFRGLRARILFWSIASLALAILAAILVIRQASLAQVDGRIDDALAQEAAELRRLAGGRDPETGRPFDGDVRRIFEVFLQRNVPARSETYLTIVDGETFERTFRAPPYRLDLDPELIGRWDSLAGAERGEVDTPAGPVEYLAIPLRLERRTRGVFVAAIFRDQETEAVATAVRGAIEVGLIALLIGSLIAWRVAEGVLRPVRAVTSTADRITSGALEQRIPVSGGDEISELSRTFNAMLDKLDEAFSTQRRFVDDAGHELRTPITVIRGHLELLDADPVDRVATLALVDDELERMNRIVNDLLTLAKSEQPDFLSLGPVDLATLTDELMAKAPSLGDREWRLAEVGRGIVVADRQRLTQAMMQLAQNAVQHTVDGGAVDIGSGFEGTTARLWVRDSGEGIPAAEQSQIFDRFSRGRRRSSDGAGLGLSIVQAIAEAHHGAVFVHSRPGDTVFTISVPVDQPIEVPP